MSDVIGVKYKASLIVSDFADDPKAITQILALQPIRTWRKGDPVAPTAKNVHHENGWLWEYPLSGEAKSLDDCVAQLLRAMAPWADRLSELSFPHERSVLAVIKATENQALLGLSVATIDGLSHIRASLDVDYYPSG